MVTERRYLHMMRRFIQFLVLVLFSNSIAAIQLAYPEDIRDLYELEGIGSIWLVIKRARDPRVQLFDNSAILDIPLSTQKNRDVINFYSASIAKGSKEKTFYVIFDCEVRWEGINKTKRKFKTKVAAEIFVDTTNGKAFLNRIINEC